MPEAVITVFGGTGFLGSAIVRTLLQQGARVRIAARRPERLHPSEHPERLTTLLQLTGTLRLALSHAYGAERPRSRTDENLARFHD